MQAVSTLKMENACLVDALGTRMSEVEALRSAAQLRHASGITALQRVLKLVALHACV